MKFEILALHLRKGTSLRGGEPLGGQGGYCWKATRDTHWPIDRWLGYVDPVSSCSKLTTTMPELPVSVQLQAIVGLH